MRLWLTNPHKPSSLEQHRLVLWVLEARCLKRVSGFLLEAAQQNPNPHRVQLLEAASIPQPVEAHPAARGFGDTLPLCFRHSAAPV